MAGADRGNLRCFEALGCGALMVSDSGVYPHGMEDGKTLLTYDHPSLALGIIEAALADPDRRLEIARRGTQLLRTDYSKSNQWQAFERIVEAL
jgi:spore maturation protein CgeB